MASVLSEIDGQLVFEDERKKELEAGDVEYKPIVETYDVVAIVHSEDDSLVDKFLDVVDKLSGFNFTKYENVDGKGNALNYDLSSCNCRDHVMNVLRGVVEKGEELENLMKAVEKVRWERLSEGILYGLAKVRGFFSLVLSMILPKYIKLEKALAKLLGPDSKLMDELMNLRTVMKRFATVNIYQ